MAHEPRHLFAQEQGILNLLTEMAEKSFCLSDILVEAYDEIPQRDDVIVVHSKDSSLAIFLWVRKADRMYTETTDSGKMRVRLTLGARLTKPKPVEPLQVA